MSSIVNEASGSVVSTSIPIQIVESLEVTSKPFGGSQAGSRRSSGLARNLSQSVLSQNLGGVALSQVSVVRSQSNASVPVASAAFVASGSAVTQNSVASQNNQSLLSARLTGQNGLLLVNDQGVTRSVDEYNAVSRIAQDLLELQNARRASNVSQRTAGRQSVQLNNNSVSQAAFLSEVEASILRADNPIQLAESEEIEVNGERGVWANKQEVVNWRGVIPISEYVINQDSNPEVITKRTQQQLEYIQELAIRYLRPPTPPAPGEIIINQLANTLTPPAPPLIIRQQPARPDTPEPLVIREAPPAPPAQVGRKVITISGKRIPPPPRKVIIERLAQLPSKPQAVLVERWLPYAEVKRRVIFNKPTQADPIVVKPRNVIVQWEAPQVNVKREFKYLGVIRANPVEYVQRYGDSLTHSNELPEFVLDIATPDGLVLAANHRYNELHELEGDVEALKLINLENEGLGQYRDYLRRLGYYRSGSRLSRVSQSGLSRSASAAVVASSSVVAAPQASFEVVASRASSRRSVAPVASASVVASEPVVSASASGVFQSASFVLNSRAPSVQSAAQSTRLPSRAQSVVSLKSQRTASVQSVPVALSVQLQQAQEVEQLEQAANASFVASAAVASAGLATSASFAFGQGSVRNSPVALVDVAAPVASRPASVKSASRAASVRPPSVPAGSRPPSVRSASVRPSPAPFPKPASRPPTVVQIEPVAASPFPKPASRPPTVVQVEPVVSAQVEVQPEALDVQVDAAPVAQATRSYASTAGLGGYSFSTASFRPAQLSYSSSENNSISSLIEKIFRSIDRNNNGRISVEDAEKILLRLNSRLGRRYGEDDVKAFFAALDINQDNLLDLDEFKRAFLNLAN